MWLFHVVRLANKPVMQVLSYICRSEVRRDWQGTNSGWRWMHWEHIKFETKAFPSSPDGRLQYHHESCPLQIILWDSSYTSSEFFLQVTLVFLGRFHQTDLCSNSPVKLFDVINISNAQSQSLICQPHSCWPVEDHVQRTHFPHVSTCADSGSKLWILTSFLHNEKKQHHGVHLHEYIKRTVNM